MKKWTVKGNKRCRRVSMEWLRKFMGIEISPNKFSSIYEFDGGTGTWDNDQPEGDEWEHIHTASSKTYYGILKA